LSNEIGIDKITLFLPVSEMTVDPHFPAKVHNSENAATGRMTSHQQLFWNGERYVTGARATYNTDNYQVTIAPDRGGGAANCLIQWSGRAFEGNNEIPLDRARLEETARDVKEELAGVGLDVPIWDAKLVRVDLAKNCEMNHPISSYTPVFGALQGRKSMNKQDFGGTGFLMGNTQRQVVLYDKGAEMHAKGLDLAECPVNTLRPECRLMKGASVRDALGAETLPDLLRGWEKIPGAYNHSLERDVFRPKMEKKIGASLDFYEEARFIMDSAFLRKWQAFKADVGLLLLVERFGLEFAKEFAAFELVEDTSTAAGKRQVKRINADLEQAAFAIAMSDAVAERTPLQELYRELKQAVLPK
jgi:hypothetical protein